MGLGGVVHEGVVIRDNLIQKLGVADVAHHELHAVGGQASDVLAIARVDELVEHGHVHPGAVLHHVVHEAGPDEAAATGDDDVVGFEGHIDWCHAT